MELDLMLVLRVTTRMAIQTMAPALDTILQANLEASQRAVLLFLLALRCAALNHSQDLASAILIVHPLGIVAKIMLSIVGF